jgi:hypothetical protein
MKDDYQRVAGLLDSAHRGGEAFQSSGNIYVAAAVATTTEIMNIWGQSIDDEAAQLQLMEKQFTGEEKVMACWNDFLAKRGALANAMTAGKAATVQSNVEIINFRNLEQQNNLAFVEGTAVFNRENDSPVGSLSHTFWVDEKIDRFKKDLEWSRRLTFMAMRAVEYEFQQSLPFRSEIVAATNASQLQDVILGLRQEQASRTINRRRPDQSSIVLSLRDDVLSVADHSDMPAGERDWTPAQRFASRLWDQRYAVRDRAGNWLGQGIPFTLDPSGILQTRCGERLWEVTATLQGDAIEETAPGAPVLLLKRNTFSSQYCNGEGPASTVATSTAPRMQVGTVHTTAELLQPGSSVDLSDANQFTAAMLYPWFNIRRTDFYTSNYQNGASQELAGRGLYGDYTLLFPKQMLDDKFALEHVEDVLLRFDYLSVDNLAQ